MFKIYFKLSCDATLGMEHCLIGYLSTEDMCEDVPSRFTECQENRGSFDPNDKRIFNEEGKEVQTIDTAEFIYYHIRFQNTGTDTAFNIRITDPLSTMLDISTFEMLSASHPYEFVINDGPALEVIFENILLPDSTVNESASHGYFKFKIKPLPEFDYGTSIPNEAAIFFDFNDAVITNLATLVIQQTTSTYNVQEPLMDFSIYPNPSFDKINLDIPLDYLQRVESYEIISMLGLSVDVSKFRNEELINVAHLKPGVYQVLLKENGNIIGVKKFIKL